MKVQIGTRSDLYEGGYTEDGERMIHEAHYVVIEVPDGRRWAHSHSFRTEKMRKAEAMTKSEALAEKIFQHLASGKKLDMEHWVEIDPAYGSKAYQKLDGKGYFRARERHEAREQGEHVSLDEPGDWFFAA